MHIQIALQNVIFDVMGGLVGFYSTLLMIYRGNMKKTLKK